MPKALSDGGEVLSCVVAMLFEDYSLPPDLNFLLLDVYLPVQLAQVLVRVLRAVPSQWLPVRARNRQAAR